jgi:hypothetical protein
MMAVFAHLPTTDTADPWLPSALTYGSAARFRVGGRHITIPAVAMRFRVGERLAAGNCWHTTDSSIPCQRAGKEVSAAPRSLLSQDH